MAELDWPEHAGPELHAAIYRVVSAVMETGGAVGWIAVPTEPETARWLAEILADARAGRARLATVGAGGRLEALGRWVWYPKAAVSVNAEILQVMVHPAARGQGLARQLVSALVNDAREHGVETLTLDVRGNNHVAMSLYESLGFVVYGRLPDFVAVGAERWDRVLYRLDLRSWDSSVRRHGARPVGPGSSRSR